MNKKNALLSTGASILVGLSMVVLGGGQANAATNFELPFPCGQVWQGQTRSGHSPANAVDLNRTNDIGDPVVASASGTVTRVAETATGESYGKWIEISHGSGWTTRYAHLSVQRVRVGQAVAQGARIGDVGNTGGSSGAHLHYEQRLNGTAQRIKLHGTTILYWGTRAYTSHNHC